MCEHTFWDRKCEHLDKNMSLEKFKILIDKLKGVYSVHLGGLGEDMLNPDFPDMISMLRKKAELVQLKEVDYKIVLEVLNDVCKKENCAVSNELLVSIAIKARGDIRAALNDLQILSKNG